VLAKYSKHQHTVKKSIIYVTAYLINKKSPRRRPQITTNTVSTI
jgi:hypothetical protein